MAPREWALLISLAGACVGCHGDGDGSLPPSARLPIAEARFAPRPIEGLGFRVPGRLEGKSDADGNFRFAVGQPVQFFVGEGDRRLPIGTATPIPGSGPLLSFTLHDLIEVQGDQDQYLANLLSLLGALDANGNLSDGIGLDAAAQRAVASAVAGDKSVDFAQSPESFRNDPVIAGALATLGRSLPGPEQAIAQFRALFPQSRSSSMAFTRSDARAIVANRERNSISIMRLRDDNGEYTARLIAEVPVGCEPRSVALDPDDHRAFVTNAVDGTMSVIDLTERVPTVLAAAVPVGTDPRAIAVTPNGAYAFVANFSIGQVTMVRLATLEVMGSIRALEHPYSIAITNDGDRNDRDERVLVTHRRGELMDPEKPGDAEGPGKSVVSSFLVADAERLSVNSIAQ